MTFTSGQIAMIKSRRMTCEESVALVGKMTSAIKVFIERERERERERCVSFNDAVICYDSLYGVGDRGWSPGIMILTGGNRVTRRKPRARATSSTTNPTWQNVNRKY